MSAHRWVTIKTAVTVTGKSRRTIYRLIGEHNLDTSTESGRTIVWLPALQRAIDTPRKLPS